ncbi:MAG: hypothetical protein ABJC26_02055 [Gemmatimonadaceae bacterium]
MSVPILLDAQKPALSSEAFLQSALSTLQARSTSKTQVLPAENEIVVDRSGLDAELAPLGFATDHVGPNVSFAGRVFKNHSWETLKICDAQPTQRAKKCTLPPNAVVVRFFDAKWIVPNTELRIMVGVYHRAEAGPKYSGIGGNVFEYFFILKNGVWVMDRIGTVIAS